MASHNISIEAVKYGDMPSKQWYMSPHHKQWYYHSSRKFPSENLSTKFLEATLDPSIRLLALGLNAMGYTTLPSCSGHYKDEKELMHAYDLLSNDAKIIRKYGLELCDVESGNILVHREPLWVLPWDRAGFIRAASGTEGKPEGYLGFVVPRSEAYRVGKAIDKSTKIRKGPNIF